MQRIVLCILLSLLSCSLLSQDCKPNPENRQQVFDSRQPNNFIAHIVVKRRHSYNATASFVSPNVVVAAGHSFREKLFSKIRSLTIYVGQHTENGEEVVLSKKTYSRRQLKTFIPSKFQHGSSPDYDYSFVALPENVTEHWFDLAEFKLIQEKADSVFITGYPADKNNVEPWKKGDHPSAVKEADKVLLYSMYTYVADSGAPVWCEVNGIYYLTAIHGTGNYHRNGCNAGVKLTGDIIEELRKFIGDNRSQL